MQRNVDFDMIDEICDVGMQFFHMITEASRVLSEAIGLVGEHRGMGSSLEFFSKPADLLAEMDPS